MGAITSIKGLLVCLWKVVTWKFRYSWFPLVVLVLWGCASYEQNSLTEQHFENPIIVSKDAQPVLELGRLRDFALRPDRGAAKEVKRLTSADNPDIQSIFALDREIKWGSADKNNLHYVGKDYLKTWRKHAYVKAKDADYDMAMVGQWATTMEQTATKATALAEKMDSAIIRHERISQTAENLYDQLNSGKLCKGRRCANFEKWRTDILDDLDRNKDAASKTKAIATEAEHAARYLRYLHVKHIDWLPPFYLFNFAKLARFVTPTRLLHLAYPVLKPLALVYQWTDIHWSSGFVVECLFYVWILFSFGLSFIFSLIPLIYNVHGKCLAKDIHRYYDRLVITDYRCTQAEIQTAYDRLAKNEELSEPAKSLIKEAYTVLSDPSERSKYNNRFGYDLTNEKQYRKKNDALQLYEVLGISSNASADDIKLAYEYHKELSTQQKSMFDINCFIAHTILSQTPWRTAYDGAYRYIRDQDKNSSWWRFGWFGRGWKSNKTANDVNSSANAENHRGSRHSSVRFGPTNFLAPRRTPPPSSGRSSRRGSRQNNHAGGSSTNGTPSSVIPDGGRRWSSGASTIQQGSRPPTPRGVPEPLISPGTIPDEDQTTPVDCKDTRGNTLGKLKHRPNARGLSAQDS